MGGGKTPQPKTRIEYIDCLRGVTMLLVVWYHLFRVGFTHKYDSSIVTFFGTFRMPLFFFISGFVAYKAAPTLQWLKDKSANRVFRLLVPTIVLGAIGLWFKGEDISILLFEHFRGGYWFTITAFEFFIVYAVVAYLLEKFRASSIVKLLTWLALVGVTSALYYLACSGKIDLTGKWVLMVGVKHLVVYFRYFLFGIIAKMFFERFIQVVENQWAMLLALVVFVVLYDTGGHLQMTTNVLCGIVLMFRFFHFFRDKFNSTTRIGRLLSLIGKNTLPVYLIHYIFLQGLSNLQGTALVDLVGKNFVIEIIFCLTLSVVIALACIAVDRALKFIPPVYALTHGFDIRSKK